MPPPLRLFEPRDAAEAAQGWAVHATRRRLVHEAAARDLDRLRLLVGSLSAALSAVAGTAAFAGWQTDGTSLAAAISTAAIGIGGGALANVLAFLDLGGRAEAHRRSAVGYKAVIRDLEQTRAVQVEAPDGDALDRVRRALDEIDAVAPVVPRRTAAAAEARPILVVHDAEDLVAEPPRPG